MILCDAGPLIALFDQKDNLHQKCRDTLSLLPDEPLLTTWPCIGEAMYILNREIGFRVQDELWQWILDDLIVIYQNSSNELTRMRELMRQYRDTPMDFADASLVAVAETMKIRQIFSIDKHFTVYRIDSQHAFEVVP